MMNLQEQSLAQLRILLAAMPQMAYFDKQREELKSEIKRREKPINTFENISDYEKFAKEYIYN